MLKGNKELTFSLPAVVDIDLREYDFVSERIRKFLKFFFHQKSALERFFDMDGHGVRKINLILGQYNRFNVLQNTTITSLDEFMDDGCQTWSKRDMGDLCVTMNKIEAKLLGITNCKRKLMDKATFGVISKHVDILILEKCDLDKEHFLIILQKVKDTTMKSLSICNCGIQR